MAVVEQVKSTDWQQWIEDRDGVLIDVREPMEWMMGTLDGAEKIRIFGEDIAGGANVRALYHPHRAGERRRALPLQCDLRAFACARRAWTCAAPGVGL